MYRHNLIVYRKKKKIDSIFPGPLPPQPLIGDDLNIVLPITTASAKKGVTAASSIIVQPALGLLPQLGGVCVCVCVSIRVGGIG